MIALNGLNPEQYEAVTTLKGSLLILAGAGTGKTRVITYRMANMLQNGISAKSIVALTFTNKAAREMKDRLLGLVGEKAKEVTSGTFHSYCLLLLKRFHRHVNLPKRFSIAGVSDQLELVRKALEEKKLNGLLKAEDVQFEISSAKNWLKSPEDVRNGKFQRKLAPDLLADLYELYERQLRLNQVIDFDDCIYKVHEMLAKFPEVKEKIHRQYEYFLVDEFQDTNAAQLSLLQQLAEKHQNICVVGDDDQSIYSWRGALYETIEKFLKSFPDTKLIKLTQNYRCTNIILNLANQLIKNNKKRQEKELWSSHHDQHLVKYNLCNDDENEAQWIALKIKGLLGRDFKPGEIGVLYRANAQARQIEFALREYNIAYKTYGGQSFFERKEVKDFLSYLKLILNPDDRLAFYRVINTPSRGIGLKTLEHLDSIAESNKCSPFQAIAFCEEMPIGEGTKKALQDFKLVLLQLKQMPRKNSDDLLDLANHIIQDFSLKSSINQKSKDDNLRQKKIENLLAIPHWLQNAAKNFLQGAPEGQKELDDLIEFITVGDTPDFSGDAEHRDHVSLMSIHSSKGLEFPAVFVCGLEEELLPHKNSLNTSQELDEERRLFYVAITRAKKYLFLSSCAYRKSRGQNISRQKSRFLAEIPWENIEDESSQEFIASTAQRAETRKSQTLSKLRSLRAQL